MPAPAPCALPVFKAPPDAHVPAAASNNVSLKVFVVELKNNCPSTCFPNTAGAVNSSVDATTAVVLPDAAKEASVVPELAGCGPNLAVDKSAISVQLVPFQSSVVAT